MIPEWKWDRVTMDFVSGLPLSLKKKDIPEDMLRCCVLELEDNWEKYLLLVEFAYNNSFKSSIKMALYEALYGHKCRTPLETEEKVKVTHDYLKIIEKVFLKVSSWKKILCFGRKGKLSLRFIGPYEIIERIGPVAYRLALPTELEKIHNVFHVSMLRRY
ncbi:reverse transcriptase [Gossypium australe]|uniref:Reverse transcriptase n=1 Tax=Gossypium australe TaxID=47621 RepID=A0A5B6VWT7_9ROSI|nr:reverse transcriptase [Gossypium australe]